MGTRPELIAAAGLLLLAAGGAGTWWWTAEPVAAAIELEPMPPPLPVPPHPPRVATDPAYEACMALLPEDPAAALAMADAWPRQADPEAGLHCRAMAVIAQGSLPEGAAMLERIGRGSTAAAVARAMVLGQAADVRLQANDGAAAMQDASDALALAPDDPALLMRRAEAAGLLGRHAVAITDLTQVLAQDGTRSDALVARAVAFRQSDQMDKARADIDRALTLSPEDPEALLERGILRQRQGNVAGARADWERVLRLDPDSLAADLAEQNLALLAAGPRR